MLDPQQRKVAYVIFGVLGTGLALLIVLGIRFSRIVEIENREKNEKARIAQQIAENRRLERWNAMSQDDHFKAAKQLLERDQPEEAQKHGAELSGNLAKKFDIEVKKYQKDIEIKRVILAGVRRKAFAKKLENNYLDQGLNITVEARGQNADILHITWALTSKVAAHKLGKNSELWANLRSMEFKKVVLTNGFEYSNETWTWNLD